MILLPMSSSTKKESTKPAKTISQEEEESTPRSIVEKSTSRKAKAGMSNESCSHQTAQKLRRSRRGAGEKLPALRVGTQRAELVGTTSDGRWILSVSETGRRIIVPPPRGLQSPDRIWPTENRGQTLGPPQVVCD
jgi:hypothetical protein